MMTMAQQYTKFGQNTEAISFIISSPKYMSAFHVFWKIMYLSSDPIYV